MRVALRYLVLGLVLLCGMAGTAAHGYSLLTHEQLVDLTWESSIVPLLLSRYPTLTAAQLEHARAYAYGGCVIQDIGYYPLGDAFFSDLTHYVRSGDFVVNLFRNAGDADELAFAVGALSHYVGDSLGHPEATNLAVPVEFPKLGRRYGPVVNYAEGEHQHVQTEFAFDINEIAHHRLAPVHYLRHVGLEVPTQQLALAFYQTYGLREDFTHGRGRRINVGAYRFAVRRFIPRIAYAVNVLHGKQGPADVDSADLQRLEREIAVVSQRNDWDAYRRRPGVGTYALAGLLRVLPKVGPLKLVAVKGPTAATEVEYLHSVVGSEDVLNGLLRRFTPPPAVRPSAALAAAADRHADPPAGASLPVAAGGAAVAADRPAGTGGSVVPRESADPQHPLENRDLDTGKPVRPSGYRLTDETYARLVHRLAAHPAEAIPPGVQRDVLAYYRDRGLPFWTKRSAEAWNGLQVDLGTLEAMRTSTSPEPYPTYGEEAEGGAHRTETGQANGKSLDSSVPVM